MTVAPWVEPYMADFRELQRQLDRVPGFIFQPVVLPSPDLARALADWLVTQGVAVRVFDMRHEPWDDLAARLLRVAFDPAEERRAVVVVTPIELDRDTVRNGFLALNSVRDTLARTLQCPLIWCGGVDLLRTTADFATDFWSIAGTVHRIPLRTISEASRAWWTGAVQENVESIAARIEQARRRGETRAVARLDLDLAEALIARGDRTDASRTLAAAEANIRKHAPSMWTRWHTLMWAAAASAADAIAGVETRIADARARHALAREALLHEELATALNLDARHAEAAGALLDARKIYRDTGDERAAAIVEQRLVAAYSDRLPPDVLADVRASAERNTRERCPAPQRALGWGVLAFLAYHGQRWDEADRAAASLLRELAADDFRRPWGLGIRLEVAELRGDWSAVAELSAALLTYALAHDQFLLALAAYHKHAHADLVLGRLKEACRGLVAARELADRLGVPDVLAVITEELADAALRLGASEVHAALLPRALALALRIEADLPLELPAGLADDELAAIVAAGADELPPRASTIARLTDLADARQLDLAARGVNLSDVHTWPAEQTT